MHESEAKIQGKMFRKFSIGGMIPLTHNARARNITVDDTHEATSQGGDSEGGGGTGRWGQTSVNMGRPETVYYGDRARLDSEPLPLPQRRCFPPCVSLFSSPPS